MRGFLITITCTILFFTSCVFTGFSPELLDVESYIQEHPDSALSALRSMHLKNIKSPKDKALHALLHAMALDKNFVDVCDDSLAQVALQYFEHRGPRKYKARSLYYRGLSYYYAHEYDKSILDFTKAEPICLECGDSLYLAMTYVAMADIYGSSYNDIQEINYLNKALDIFTALREEYYIDVIKGRLGSAYSNSRQFEDADRILHDLIHRGQADSRVRALAMSSYAYLQMIKPEINPSLADYYYTQVCEMGYNDFISIRGYWAWAAAMSILGKDAESKILVEQLLPSTEPYISDYWRYVICKNNGDNISALNFFERSGYNANDVIEKTLRQSVAIYQRDYYNAQATLESLKVRNRTTSFCCILVILLLFIVFVSYVVLREMQAMKRERAELVNFAQRLVNQLTNEHNERTELRKKYLALHQAKYGILRNLCDQYYTIEDRVDVEKLMLKNISALIDSIKCNEKTQVKFEKMLNKERDNIVMHLRTEMPKLKDLDYALFCYYVVGFDAITISRFLGMSESNIYAHKRRLRLKIEKAHPQHERLFLEVF